MTKTNVSSALFSAYRKPNVRTTLRNFPSLQKERKPAASPAILPPVLYHGTCGLQTLNWQKTGGIGGRSFSLSPGPFFAAIYAKYEFTRETLPTAKASPAQTPRATQHGINQAVGMNLSEISP